MNSTTQYYATVDKRVWGFVMKAKDGKQVTREGARGEKDLEEERGWAEKGLEGVCLVEGEG